ncbi:MAG TPA: hypothetical protein VN685_05530 [Rhizomicrobium sp.]|nr:hypothetical protein [Rhizomicrobium sp.]
MMRAMLMGSFCAAALVLPALGQNSQSANLLGAFGNWTAYSTGTGDGITCFAMSRPRATEPKRGLKRGSIYLIVTDYPARKIKAEPEIVPGYQYKDKAPVSLEVGEDKFEFFGRNEAKEGSAWLASLNDGRRLIDAMSKGVSAVALGSPIKGAKSMDTYSLDGFNDALAKIHAACNM